MIVVDLEDYPFRVVRMSIDVNIQCSRQPRANPRNASISAPALECDRPAVSLCPREFSDVMTSVDPYHNTSTWTTLWDSPEVITVMSVNLSLAILGFVLAFYLTRLRCRLARLSDWLLTTEQYSRQLLPLACTWLGEGHEATQQARDRLQQTQLRLQLLQQSLSVIVWILRRRGRIRQ